MSEKIKYMDIKEFIDLGYLQELNRNFLHPFGLALEVYINRNDEYSLGGIWDYREDPEGMMFGEGAWDERKEKADFIHAEWEERAKIRFAELGWVIQPIEDEEENGN